MGRGGSVGALGGCVAGPRVVSGGKSLSSLRLSTNLPPGLGLDARRRPAACGGFISDLGDLPCPIATSHDGGACDACLPDLTLLAAGGPRCDYDAAAASACPRRTTSAACSGSVAGSAPLLTPGSWMPATSVFSEESLNHRRCCHPLSAGVGELYLGFASDPAGQFDRGAPPLRGASTVCSTTVNSSDPVVAPVLFGSRPPERIELPWLGHGGLGDDGRDSTALRVANCRLSRAELEAASALPTGSGPLARAASPTTRSTTTA